MKLKHTDYYQLSTHLTDSNTLWLTAPASLHKLVKSLPELISVLREENLDHYIINRNDLEISSPYAIRPAYRDRRVVIYQTVINLLDSVYPRSQEPLLITQLVPGKPHRSVWLFNSQVRIQRGCRCKIWDADNEYEVTPASAARLMRVLMSMDKTVELDEELMATIYFYPKS